jgi:hypothetical protein
MAEVSIETALAALPESSITTYALRGLDFVVPGQWENIRGFDDMVRSATGEADPGRRAQIASAALQVYAAEPGFHRALWLYQVTDKADAALGTAAMANKIGERISFLSFLNRFTPAADTTQSIDLGLKVVVELLSFCFMNGFPRDREGLSRFVHALSNEYRHESLMRMAALVCLDGLIPLGPDFLGKVTTILERSGRSEIGGSPLFSSVGEMIPGETPEHKLGFVTESFRSVRGWMDGLLQKRGLTVEKVTGSLKKYIDFADDKLDYLAAFFDLSTSYYAHTGTQTVARYAILRAAERLGAGGQLGAGPGAPAFAPPPPMMIAPPPPTAVAVALYDYAAQSASHLNVTAGERLTLQGGDQGGWVLVSNQRGQQGWVPRSYLRI